jgi:hypothetical protein
MSIVELKERVEGVLKRLKWVYNPVECRSGFVVVEIGDIQKDFLKINNIVLCILLWLEVASRGLVTFQISATAGYG